MNVNSNAFAVKKTKTAGGFGNKQASHALQLSNVVYRDVLVHSINLSVQEYQKKLKMFQKKVTKKQQLEKVQQPEINYMNIYTQSVPRLSCFSSITSKYSASEGVLEYETYQEGGYFYGDATAYEHQLDKVLKQLSNGTVPQNTGIVFDNS